MFNAYISELLPLLNPMPPDGIGINWKRRKYNLDCREVARGTQSAFSCLCSYSTFDIAKAL